LESIDAKSAVIGEGRESGKVGRLTRLQIGIVDERVPDLFGLREI